MMTINNSGDEVGFTLEISGGPAKNPTIYNALTDEYMQISGDIQKGDVITITTKTGNKTVLLEREGVVTNIINRLGFRFNMAESESRQKINSMFVRLRGCQA